jgi:hypothetical protein
VQASYARTGYRSEGRLTRIELENALAKMVGLMQGLPVPAPVAPAAKAAAAKPEKKTSASVQPTLAAKAVTTPTKEKAAPKDTTPQTPYEVYRRGPGSAKPDKTSPEYVEALRLAKDEMKKAVKAIAREKELKQTKEKAKEAIVSKAKPRKT